MIHPLFPAMMPYSLAPACTATAMRLIGGWAPPGQAGGASALPYGPSTSRNQGCLLLKGNDWEEEKGRKGIRRGGRNGESEYEYITYNNSTCNRNKNSNNNTLKHKQLNYACLITSYDLWPGNRASLFSR